MAKKQIYLGRNRYINNGIDMSDEFLIISKNDEKATQILCQQGLYNQAAYFYIQSMEKYIKSFICKKIDVTNDYYANRLRTLGHSLDTVIVFLLKLYQEMMKC